MSENGRHTTVVPSARRLMSSLRDIGYDTASAIADLVDNSIDAQARHVDITITQDGARSWIRIADDGYGMTPRELDEAMRYGSRREYGRQDLGHFGLGLKTASLSQCRRLTVASRTTERGRIHVRRWDLDEVSARDSWDLERITPRDCPRHLLDPLRPWPGTVVLWERLDRILGYARPDGAAARRAVDQLRDEVASHLSMVFHRFLAGELGRGRGRLRITLNGEQLRPWDPFSRDEPATQVLETQWVSIRQNGRARRIRIQPYVLPTQIQYSSPDAHREAAGPKRWNRQQGFYIYRRDRLIQSGGWNRIRTLDEHSKLARIAIDIPPSAEAAFQINVSKMVVVLPPTIRAGLAAVASGVAVKAQDAYRQRVKLILGEAAPRLEDDGLGAPIAGWEVDQYWDLVVDILEGELADQPDTLRRVLISLANARSRIAPADTAAS